MKYILIQNDGEIESNSFELIGASTKRGETGKIGFFGSGLKYSIAYMMRKKINFRIFSGEQELIFTTKDEVLKTQTFQRIIINGIPTSYTTTMGPTWKEDWFVLREIYCNALDENSCLIIRDTENVSPTEGKTRIYIELTESLKQVSDSWDIYFAEDREPIFTSSDVYTCYLGNDDEISADNQKVAVYIKTLGILYRKGIRVFQTDTQMYDYNCEAVNINEDRTAKNPSGIQYGIFNIVAQFIDEGYIKSILRTAQDDVTTYEYAALSVDTTYNWSKEWLRFSEENLLVVKEGANRYVDEINQSKKETFLLPFQFARNLKKTLPEVYILGMNSIIDGLVTESVELTNKMEYLLKEVIAALKEMKYEILYDISVVRFDNENIMGKADLKERKILIAGTTFDKGRREIAMTLIEENEHLKSGEKDESRAFQNHIFSQWLKTMEENNAIFL
jgi:hypothetical protein